MTHRPPARRRAARSIPVLVTILILLVGCGRLVPTPTPAAPVGVGAATATRPASAPPTPSAAPVKPSTAVVPGPTTTVARSISPTAAAATLPLLRLPDIAGAADRARPAVAFIAVRTAAVGGLARASPRAGVGSGAIVDPRGYIVTNNHVVEGGQQLRVVLPDGRSFDASLVGRDPVSDLAVLKVDGQNLPVATMGDSDRLKVGEWVVAIGNALGLEGGPTVTAGVVSNVGRTVELPGGGGSIEGAIQTDTAINPGNSGGPLVNLNGEIVGINTLVAAQVSPDYQAQGIGFAIAINNARPIVAELIARGRVERPWLGVSVGGLTPAIAAELGIPYVEAVVIAQAVPGGPAARAGLRQNDLILSIDGERIKSTAGLRDLLIKKKVGDRVEVVYQRGGREARVVVTLAARPAQG